MANRKKNKICFKYNYRVCLYRKSSKKNFLLETPIGENEVMPLVVVVNTCRGHVTSTDLEN